MGGRSSAGSALGRIGAIAGLSVLGLISTIGIASAQPAAGAPIKPPASASPGEGGPPMRLEPAPEEGTPPAYPNTPESTPAAAPSSVPHAKRRTPAYHKITKFAVEPARAKVRVNRNTVVYASPTPLAKPLEHLKAGGDVQVTGSTRHFLRVELKGRGTGYVEQSAVDMVKKTDKVFRLTSDSPVREAPNKWAMKLAEVHKGHDVHTIGIALDYVKIRMRSGLEGYIPQKALE
ncbi:MAG: hypothetical protein ACREP6_16020 [Candidatus Binataceae bacterium]